MNQLNHAEIGNRLQGLRSVRGEREIDISIVLDISQAHYCRLEQGKTKITVDVLQKACTYYGVTAEYILFGMRKNAGVVWQTMAGYSEAAIRRLLKIFGCMLITEKYEGDTEDAAMYKLLMGGLMELVPIDAASAIPTVLEYEKNRRDVSENVMIRELKISRFIWTSIMHNKPIRDIEIPLRIQDKYGYGLDFLINNRVQDDMFLETQLLQKPIERQQEIMHAFNEIVKMQDKQIE